MHKFTRPDELSARVQGLTRRAMGALALGGATLVALGARAQSPAQAIRTPELGLSTATFNIPTSDNRVMPAYAAYPAGRGRFPVIVLVSESSGLDDYIRDVARRLARAGYFAIAPDFFFRAGDPAAATAAGDNATLTRIVVSATNEQVMSDLSAVLFWAKSQPAAARNFGITGFSWGGAFVWMALQRFPDFRAGVAWYGRLSKPPSNNPLGAEVRPWPLEIIPTLRAPILGLYAGQDPGIPMSDIAAAKDALVANRKRNSDIILYERAQHFFHRDDRPSYDPAAASDAWARMLDHFAKNGLRGNIPRELRR